MCCIFDMDNGDFIIQTSDDMGIDTDGNLMMRMGDNYWRMDSLWHCIDTHLKSVVAAKEAKEQDKWDSEQFRTLLEIRNRILYNITARADDASLRSGFRLMEEPDGGFDEELFLILRMMISKYLRRWENCKRVHFGGLW